MCPGGCAAYHDDGEGGRRLLASSKWPKPAWTRGQRRGGSCGGSSPGRFIVTGLLSELDSPLEYYLTQDRRTIYIYPPEGFDVNTLRLDAWAPRNEFVNLLNSKHVHVKGFTIRGVGSKDGLKVTGGSYNIFGGNVIKSCANGISITGGYHNQVVGNDIYDIRDNHMRINGNAGDGPKNLVPTNNVIQNNHLTMVHLRFEGAWKVSINGQGTRFSNNLIHDSPIQVSLPGLTLSESLTLIGSR